MAIVQTLPVSIESATEGASQLCTSASSSPANMGSVSSLISGRPCHKATSEFGAFPLRGNAGSQELLCHGLPTKKTSYAYGNEEDWTEAVSPISPCSDAEDLQDEKPRSGIIRGPPPKLVPVSGKLEKNIEKTLIRPTAFKPVMPKNRNLPLQSHLVLCPGTSVLSESQSSLAQLFGANAVTTAEKLSSLSCRTSSHSGTMSDSGRNSLSSLPTYSTGGSQQIEPVSLSIGHANLDSHGSGSSRGLTGPSNSDSGRSSSSKSTGSLSGRGHPSSDSGSCEGRSPMHNGADEALLVHELEEKLREREAELQHLRESLDENEVAICQPQWRKRLGVYSSEWNTARKSSVYEEKQRRCEEEMEELRQGFSAKLQQSAQKAQRSQQVLQLQIYQLQQEKKKLQEDFVQLLAERELLEQRCANFEREHTELGPRLEETKWEVCQKSGEISLLKQQLKESHAEVVQRGNELVLLRAQLREARAELQTSEEQALSLQEMARTKAMELEVCANELARRKSEAELLREKVGRLEHELDALRSTSGELCPLLAECDEVKAQRQAADTLQGLRAQAERLRTELLCERRRGEEQREVFQAERITWQSEKDRVIRYQKQLQHNYIQMYRHNRDLECQLRHLSLELEARDMDEYELHGSEGICLEEIAATEI
ncbi:leucine zipper putative tumor suppressor 2 isoform X1 [Ahaetulla prasina]|uniref:leucine zipper putative tumor suppressor 2 isoform X1 n=1 Tax=Ahaetulla prasina TaxID=499056 RepID=UPI002649E6D2|nr:leucine zipper putative tumor suppressor 2 isoform X1 [Ahaetulla prasina]XP_058043537.1 leucine zipper putative tumor suppressor 2 isoform X1 [Ahaetulla prasina]XP_058043538.1 leucine zipper putative tumor suppressor 2 isoform X1 [Ahaetulla prasina]XP_058043539.1 leucine zipper putative tumor suppressor 2 isoform X1 [Ahaetulla prasina]XP_058043540.1 leucine zipper putative tumor suppressor 2 isoform X1 [Ahaetulla prasina]XP_058043541.1 leucine zipper putative tumor suppressor 2 isoform X1 [